MRRLSGLNELITTSFHSNLDKNAPAITAVLVSILTSRGALKAALCGLWRADVGKVWPGLKSVNKNTFGDVLGFC